MALRMDKPASSPEVHLPAHAHAPAAAPEAATTADTWNRRRDKRRVERYLRLAEVNAAPGAPAPIFCDGSGVVLARGYRRIVYGDHGAYVEFDFMHLVRSGFAAGVEKDRGKYYDMLRTAGDGTVLYCQTRTVADRPCPPRGSGAVRIGRKEGYADYVVGRYYVSCKKVGVLANVGMTTTGMDDGVCTVADVDTGGTVVATDAATCACISHDGAAAAPMASSAAATAGDISGSNTIATTADTPDAAAMAATAFDRWRDCSGAQRPETVPQGAASRVLRWPGAQDAVAGADAGADANGARGGETRPRSPTSATGHRHSPVPAPGPPTAGAVAAGAGAGWHSRWRSSRRTLDLWATVRSSKERRICRGLESKFGDDLCAVHALQGCVRLTLKAACAPAYGTGDGSAGAGDGCMYPLPSATVLETLREVSSGNAPLLEHCFVMLACGTIGQEGSLDAIADAGRSVDRDALRRALCMRQWLDTQPAARAAASRLGIAEDAPVATPTRALPCRFVVKAKRGGKHSFSSDDAKRALAASIARHSPCGLKPSCRDPELLLMLQIHLTSVWVGLSLRPLGRPK